MKYSSKAFFRSFSYLLKAGLHCATVLLDYYNFITKCTLNGQLQPIAEGYSKMSDEYQINIYSISTY